MPTTRRNPTADEPEKTFASGPEAADREDDLAWLREAAEEEIRRKQPRVVTRATRLRRDEAERVDRMAEEAGLDAASFMRLMLLGERPDMKAYVSALRKVYALVLELDETAAEGPLSAEDVRAHREAVEDVLRILKPPASR
jgi:hypothetical protein